MKSQRVKSVIGFFILLVTCNLLLVTLSGCTPTYPKADIEGSILKLCKKEYKLDVKVATAGKTIAIYMPLPDLLDFNFNITESAGKKINDVIIAASRVALSTDAKFDFFCIMTNDIRIPEMQMVAVRYIDDVKRGFLGDVSRNEYFKRMVIDFRLNPQSQKERAIKEVFEKMGLENKWQDAVMNDFFRAEPNGLGEIGYWNGRFYIKDIELSEFLAAQIAGRIRYAFKENKELENAYLVKSAKAVYSKSAGVPYFRFEALVERKLFGDIPDTDVAKVVFAEVIKIAANVMHDYNFSNFDHIEILNQSDGRVLKVSRDGLEKFKSNKVKLEEIVH